MDEFLKHYGTRSPGILIGEAIRRIDEMALPSDRRPGILMDELRLLAEALTKALESYVR